MRGKILPIQYIAILFSPYLVNEMLPDYVAIMFIIDIKPYIVLRLIFTIISTILNTFIIVII